jgi:hypothetical protein
MDLYRLNSDGTWTSVATGMVRTIYLGITGGARYRGKIYVPLVEAASQIKMLEWDGSTSAINAATGLWNDIPMYTAHAMTAFGGCIQAWRERLLLGQYAQQHSDSIVSLVDFPNYLYAFDPVAGAGVNYQKLLGGPGGTHATTIVIPNRSTTPLATLYHAIQRSHLGFGTYRGKVYLLGVDGGVREYTPSGEVTATPIFSFKSAFSTLGPYTAHATANPDPNGLRVALSSGGNLGVRDLIYGMEVTCDGRVGVCVGRDAATDPITWYLRDASDNPMGNFPAGASYTVKQGLGFCGGVGTNFYHGNISAAFFNEYNGVMYVLICGTQVSTTTGAHCPSILARWDGTTATFVGILYSSATLDAAGANVHVDQSTGIMHVVYYRRISETAAEWLHVAIDLSANPPVVLSTTAFASETWPTNVPRFGLGYAQSALFNHDRPTAEVTATLYDATQNKMTVTYSLYDDSSNACNITIETDFGTGWFEATRKGSEGEGKTGLTSSPSGVEHTFVHDLGADGSPQVTRIQYKVTASQP